ncbi:MAG: hypothetical protein JWM27_1326 [Gemmatimonadetes bacterium]|nr:hypothetical protein [Gemmatimonadota bacterium]
MPSAVMATWYGSRACGSAAYNRRQRDRASATISKTVLSTAATPIMIVGAVEGVTTSAAATTAAYMLTMITLV